MMMHTELMILSRKSQLPAEMKKEGSLYSWDGELWVDWENKKYGVYKYNVEDKNL